ALGPHYLRLYGITVLCLSSASDPVCGGAGWIALVTEHGAILIGVETHAYPESAMEVLLSRKSYTPLDPPTGRLDYGALAGFPIVMVAAPPAAPLGRAEAPQHKH
ncbi:MAG TPA: hypothetical protein VLQ80_30060, partial [Candidatus Saccharimonadia bacterium]|nr:hypothetical protein [Candidatus Saccharimonadia bacterium]